MDLEPSGAERVPSNKQNIAFVRHHLMVSFGGFEITGKNRLARLKPLDALDFRDIQQNAAPIDAVASNINGTFVSAARANFRAVKAVVHFAAIEDVAECVEMGDRMAVRRNCEIISAIGAAARVMPKLLHQMSDGKRIVGGIGGGKRQRE